MYLLKGDFVVCLLILSFYLHLKLLLFGHGVLIFLIFAYFTFLKQFLLFLVNYISVMFCTVLSMQSTPYLTFCWFACLSLAVGSEPLPFIILAQYDPNVVARVQNPNTSSSLHCIKQYH